MHLAEANLCNPGWGHGWRLYLWGFSCARRVTRASSQTPCCWATRGVPEGCFTPFLTHFNYGSPLLTFLHFSSPFLITGSAVTLGWLLLHHAVRSPARKGQTSAFLVLKFRKTHQPYLIGPESFTDGFVLRHGAGSRSHHTVA